MGAAALGASAVSALGTGIAGATMGSGPSTPFYAGVSAPNAYDTTNQALQQNLFASLINNTMGQQNQSTPYGSLNYAQTGSRTIGGENGGPSWTVPTYSVTQSLSPTEQAKYDSWNNLFQQSVNKVQNLGAAPTLDMSNLYDLPTSQDQLRSDAYNALTARSTSDINRAEGSQRTALANQGIFAGTQAYDRAMDQYNRARTDASNQATINAGTIAQQNLEQALGVRQEQVGERQASYNAAMQGYQLPYQQLFGFASGNPVTPSQWTQPNYSPVSPVDLSQNVYASQAAAAHTYDTGYNAQLTQALQQQQEAAAMKQELIGSAGSQASSLFGAAGRAGGFGKLFGIG